MANLRKSQFVSLIVIVAIILLAVFLWQSRIRPYSTPYIEIIVDGTITVNASSYISYNFSVPSGASSSNLRGTFTVSHNLEAIRVYVMDSENFVAWQNNRTATMYYNSGEINSGNITVPLPSVGTYYLVYDNTFSLTPKNVTSQINSYYVPG